jgi:RNA recognition motif-containing protein
VYAVEVSEMSIRLYVGNLSKDIQREAFETIFAEYSEDLVSVKLISDKKTGKCRGFGFVTVKTEEKADEIVDKLNGQLVEDTPLKIEKALPRSKGSSGAEEPSNNSKRSKGSSTRKSSSTSTGSSAAQPDPRWADELEKLKQMLATQTTSS